MTDYYVPLGKANIYVGFNKSGYVSLDWYSSASPVIPSTQIVMEKISEAGTIKKIIYHRTFDNTSGNLNLGLRVNGVSVWNVVIAFNDLTEHVADVDISIVEGDKVAWYVVTVGASGYTSVEMSCFLLLA